MCLYSFYHKLLFDPLTIIMQFTILNLFLIHYLQSPLLTATFGLVLYNSYFLCYGVRVSSTLVYKLNVSEV